MNGSPIYVLVPAQDYKDAIFDYKTQGNAADAMTPNNDELFQSGDFIAEFGTRGYICNRTVNVNKEMQAKSAKELADYFELEKCHVDGRFLVFEDGADIEFATKQLEKLKKMTVEMTPQEYVDMGE